MAHGTAVEVPSFTLLDAMVSYTTGPWRFALNATNLADKTYIGSCTWLLLRRTPPHHRHRHLSLERHDGPATPGPRQDAGPRDSIAARHPLTRRARYTLPCALRLPS